MRTQAQVKGFHVRALSASSGGLCLTLARTPELALRARQSKGFSLLEVILALIVVALIMAVLGAALTGTLKMERSARAVMGPDTQEEAFLAQFREDLLATAKPMGTLAGPLVLTHAQVGEHRADTLVFRTCGAIPLHPSLAIRAPDAGLAEVTWAPVADADPKRGFAWVRTRQTNLLATGTMPAPVQEVMLEGLFECQVQALTGGVFTDGYNSDDLGALLPKLVRLQFSYLRPDGTAGPSHVVVLPLPQVDMDPTQLSGGAQ